MGLFGKEKITLKLEKFDYKPGDKIKGTVKLNLKKPTKARKLEVSFIGTKIDKQTGLGIGPMANNNRQTRTIKVYDFTMPLDGEKNYQEEEYSFEIKIPEDILQTAQKLNGKIGTAITAFKTISGVYSRVDWYVKSELDVPLGLDVKKTQKIVLS
ncbi:hypothetical protein AYK20_01055 [Thermoplasmatales archaeon SG8-52-1]|nr:MAG: hypothetical protein AYK20_01055 [Thermoplasmatales archaeon SG8-52-1]